jgi:hypothetical protein
MKQEMKKNNQDLFDSGIPEGLKIFRNAVDYFS